MDAACPAPEDLDDLAAGVLDARRAEQIRNHVDDCSSCRVALGRLAHDEAVATEPTICEPALRIGRYKIERKIGSGGMGDVLLAEDSELHRKVVIKLLRLGVGADDGQQRLLREAQAMAQVSHPNVVPIFDVGVHDNHVFIAMEYLECGDLAAWLATARPLHEVLEVFVAAGRGLAAAHRAELIHRDFKPHNVLLGARGEVKVSDFGLARAASESPRGERLLDKTITDAGTVVGTPAYMAPEQLLGRPLDARADQFSFCVALYEGLCGRRPSDAVNVAQLLDAAMAGTCPEEPLRARSVPSRIRAALRRGLSGDPDTRFASMEALLAELVADQETTSGRYTILGRLAGGGMADIFLARTTPVAGVERHVVLKRVKAELGRDAQLARMFLDEARLAAQLHHPNIAQVYDIGKLGDAYFFTMEYVHGADLRSIAQALAKEQRAMPIALALHVAAGALAALHHAHERVAPDGRPLCIVHRDVSPSNVMVAYEGAIKLVDFGVAKATHNSEETAAGRVKGKTTYMSPEQCRGQAVDRRSDIFSLGVLLYELLTGKRLFPRDNEIATMHAIINDEVPPPSTHRAEVSPQLDAIVMLALEKDRERRFATAAEMLEAIERLAMREQHLLSSTTMARFVKELLGERPLPWLDLAPNADVRIVAAEVETQAAPAPPLALTVAAGPGAARQIEAMLNDAPTIGLRGKPAVPVPTSRRNLGWLLIVAPVIGVAAAMIWWRATTQPETQDVVPMRVAAIDTAQQVVADIDAGIDAPRASIADAVSNLDWDTALSRCAATASLSATEHADCGVAACEARRRDAALAYYRSVPTTARARVERACLQRGIKLVRAEPKPRRPTAPTKEVDPCEKHPLECQK